MKIKLIFTLMLVFIYSALFAQDNKDIMSVIDDLTIKWDKKAVELNSIDGLKNYCRLKNFRDQSKDLLNKIHHYDSVLYKIVKEKYNADENAEAKATLEDIETLEQDYTTKNYLQFLRQECIKFNDIERNYLASEKADYDKRVSELEKEINKFITAITKQIDIVDEHVHHLEGL
ncbi:MAG TPA: hypothetical protein ACFCUD_14100 [Cyclobacteriaceae bacterium]